VKNNLAMKILKSTILLFIFISILANKSIAQDSIQLNKKRLTAVISGSISLYAVSTVGLYYLWYADYPLQKFHFFNDNDEWQQFDKAGHFATAWYESLIGIEALKWSGVAPKKAILYGGLYGIIFQTPIEIMDGFSEHWGASAGDLLANALGSALLTSQYLLWNEQKIQLKYSFHRTKYAPLRPEILGSNLAEEILKDYNGGTIWLSTPINNLYPGKKILPSWLSLSVGYGAEEMVAGRLQDTPDNLKHYNYIPYRQYFLALDINPLKIKTKNKALTYLFTALSLVKIPAPAIEFSKKGIKLHPLYF